jgi:hypothetical protein
MKIITKILGIILVGLFLIGLVVEAATKLSIGLLMVAFWGLVLVGLWESCSFVIKMIRKP